MSSEPTESVFIKSFEGRDTADQAYETMRQLERERKVDIRTAMTIAREEDGKLKLVHKRRLTVGKGLVAGGGVGLLFLWQLPHFLAINWICREEYEQAGYRMWSNGDESGKLTAMLATWDP